MFKTYEFDADIQAKNHKAIKNFNMDEVVAFYLREERDYAWSPQFAIWEIEKEYNESERKVVFIDDNEANALLGMKFNAITLDSLLAYGSQIEMLCLNTTFNVRGVRVYSAIHEIAEQDDFRERFRTNVRRFLPTASFDRPEPSDQLVLKLITNCKDGINNYITLETEPLLRLMALDLDECFKPNVLKEISPDIAMNLDNDRALETQVSDNEEQISLMLAVRLSVAYMLFNQMTSYAYLKAGCPKIHKASLKYIKQNSSFEQLDMPREYKERALHLRAGHFRQLVAERYYQGEHDWQGNSPHPRNRVKNTNPLYWGF